ncbi:glycosyltransferase [Algoriphagus vanfongensis]|uniref:glycosyltransferase n=1 Tax=Algoriphagus vanfongensis TaxID=426371 RepID=UPI000404729F|nr:glycosyltransferase [Algoriphagus vanfongensis]
MAKTRILHLIKSLGRGGAEKLIPQTALVHDQSKFEFHCLYFYHQKENIVDELEAAGVQVHLIPSGNLGLFFQVNKVCEFVRENEFDLIHAHLPWAGILARLVGKKVKIPIVYTEHNTWDRYNKLSYWGNRLTFKNQDIAIAVSYEVALSMQLNSIWDPYQRGGRLQVKVIQNGVNTDVFVKKEDELALKEKLAIPLDSPIIGKVAVFRSQKRLWLWVEVAIKILQQFPQVHFLLVGDGEWRSKLENQISASGWQDHFHLVGVQKDVLPYLRIMDIYMSSSEFEGLPIAMLEAMSCEVPVVATRAGGIGEVILHGKQGYLCGIDDWEELEKYCLQLLQNPTARDEMGEASRKQVLENFSMKKMVAELESIYLASQASKSEIH